MAPLPIFRYTVPGLDLRLPRKAMDSPPILIIDTGRPNTSSSVRSYVLNVLSQIDAQIDAKPMLDDNGNRICTDRTYEYLIVLDQAGRLIGINARQESGLDPRRINKITNDYVLNAAQNISSFPPFPEAERLGGQLVGIPSRLDIKCRHGWTRTKKPPKPFNSASP